MSGKPKIEAAFLLRLREEIAAWQQEGILSPQQAGRIEDRYDFSPAERLAGAERNRAVAIVTMAGAALLGVGVILFVAANWPVIPRWGRFGLVLAGMAALLGAGHEVGWRRGFPAVGRGLVVAGCLLYGAGIWLIAQTFNISSHEPNGLLAWSLGILPLAAVLRSSPLATLFALLLVSWHLFEVIGFDRPNPWFFPLMIATAAPLIYRDRLRFPAWVLALGLTASLGFTSARWPGQSALEWGTPAVLGGWGGVMVLLGRLHDRRNDLAALGTAWRLPGHLLLGSVLLIFTFHDSVVQFLLDRSPPGAFRIFLSGTAVAALGLFFLHGHKFRNVGESSAARAVLAEAGVAAASVFAIAVFLLKPGGTTAWPWVVLFDVLYVVYCGVLIYLADRLRVWWTGYLGVVMFTGFVVCRYFEYAIRLLPKSFVFIAAGALLLVGGVLLEKRRRAGGKEATP